MNQNNIGVTMMKYAIPHALLLVTLGIASALADERAQDPVRVVIFDFARLDDANAAGQVPADFIAAKLAANHAIDLVNRADLAKAMSEHKLVITGLVDPNHAVELGKLVSADLIITGSVLRVGTDLQVIAKVSDVETSIQKIESAKASATSGLQVALDRLIDPLVKTVSSWHRTETAPDHRFEDLKRRLTHADGKNIAIVFDEQHLTRTLRDPAVFTQLSSMFTRLGMNVILMPDPLPTNWRDELTRNGKIGEVKVDFLLTGQGISEYAAETNGFISCRARVEMKLVPVPGNVVVASEAAHASGVDLSEALAAKKALQNAAREAAIKTIGLWAEQTGR